MGCGGGGEEVVNEFGSESLTAVRAALIGKRRGWERKC